MNHLFAATFSLLALTLGQVSPASAGPATDVVKAKQTALFDLLKRGGGESQKKIGVIFDEMLDYDTLAERSLGSEWAARSDAEKRQFTELLKQLVRRSYERNLKKTLNFNIEYLGEKESNGALTVKTRAVSRTDAREEPVEIAYKLARSGDTWRVQDIITEGVSLVGSYRAQFTKIIKKDGFPALIQKMKDKLAKGDV
jgi:phospholipid transport system substrate-binding protein